ncbi:MAG: hypothetical protein WAU70_17145 [Flavobacteriales bacterium]
MKPIGGFFELELPRGGGSPHPGAVALCTGRACLTVLLQHLKPKLVHVPYHTCDASLEPFRRSNVGTRFYALDEDLHPVSLPDLASGEYFLWIDYYGVCGAITERLKTHYSDRLIIDDTHAFYRGGHAGHWSFTSARKYFGVPDGAFLFAPVPVAIDAARFAAVSLDHGLLRLLGRQAEAYRAYTSYERSLTGDVQRISAISEGLLRGVDHEAVKSARRRNFRYFHEQLGASNTFRYRFDPADVPFCYPYLPAVPIDRPAMYEKGLFAPQLWPDELERGIEGYAWEKRLSTELLPLPVDHRYTVDDLRRFVEHLQNPR